MKKAPSFKGYHSVSELSSKIKQNNRRSDIKHEILLRRELWKMGLRFRKNVSSLPGKPDIVFKGSKVAVFCDGDFWHGRNWQALREKLENGSNAGYWAVKIAANIERDTRNTRMLEEDGWKVIRLWETDIKRAPDKAAIKIKEIVDSRRRNT